MAADTDSALYSWSTTESNNKPTGATTVGTNWDDNLRMIQKVTRGWLASKGADIASAGTTDLGAIEGLMHDITGTTPITAFGTVSAGIWKILKYEGVLTLTHNATSLILLGAANRTTADGDTQIVISEGSGNWREIAYFIATSGPQGVFTTGDVKLTIKTTADPGWVLMNDTTIGNGASGATGRANADTVALWTLLYNNTVNADCAVSGGRGASAAIDYAANKTIALPKALGRALATFGTGSGLTARTLAKALGDENPQAHTHTGTTGGQSADHFHMNQGQGATGAGGLITLQSTASSPANNVATDQTAGTSADHTHAFTTASSGAGSAGNMQPTLFLNTMIKL